MILSEVKNIKLEIKISAYSEALQYRQTYFPLHITTRKNFPNYTRCSENYNNTYTENPKIRGFKFDTL